MKVHTENRITLESLSKGLLRSEILLIFGSLLHYKISHGFQPLLQCKNMLKFKIMLHELITNSVLKIGK